MLHLTSELLAQYGSSNLCGYQFVNQEVLYSLFILRGLFKKYLDWPQYMK